MPQFCSLLRSIKHRHFKSYIIRHKRRRLRLKLINILKRASQVTTSHTKCIPHSLPCCSLIDHSLKKFQTSDKFSQKQYILFYTFLNNDLCCLYFNTLFPFKNYSHLTKVNRLSWPAIKLPDKCMLQNKQIIKQTLLNFYIKLNTN